MSEEMKTPNPNPNGAKPMKSEEDVAMDMMGYNKNSFGGFDRTKGELDKRINYKGNTFGTRPYSGIYGGDKTYGRATNADEMVMKSAKEDPEDFETFGSALGNRYNQYFSKADQRNSESYRYNHSKGTLPPLSEEEKAMDMMGYDDYVVTLDEIYNTPYRKGGRVPSTLYIELKNGHSWPYEMQEGDTVNGVLETLKNKFGDNVKGVYDYFDDREDWEPDPSSSIWKEPSYSDYEYPEDVPWWLDPSRTKGL